MQNNLENVILFPKWKLSLEEESLQALREKKYSTALKKLNQLIHYDVTSHEIIFSKLICLTELGHYDEAQDLCERQLKNKCDHYYDYVHLYLTILFQTGQYNLLMEQVEYELNNPMLPTPLEGQFRQLHQLSKKMNNDIIAERATDHIQKLQEAIEEENDLQQWRLIRHLHKLNSEPTKETISMLTKNTVHPVTKTAIFNWLQEKKVNETVTVIKFNEKITVKPIAVPRIKEHEIYQLGLQLIHKDTQQNPTLTKLLEQLLFRYIFVRFPNVPIEEEISYIVEAIKQIGKLNLHMNEVEEMNEKVLKYMEDVKLYEALYLSIIEE